MLPLTPDTPRNAPNSPRFQAKSFRALPRLTRSPKKNAPAAAFPAVKTPASSSTAVPRKAPARRSVMPAARPPPGPATKLPTPPETVATTAVTATRATSVVTRMAAGSAL